MIFDSSYIKESDETLADDKTDVDAVMGGDNPDDVEELAKQVELHMSAAAMAEMSFFEGGEEAMRKLTESTEIQALVEGRKMAKRTFVRLGKADDLQRRQNLACLVLAKSHNDGLWKKLALNRINERKLRNAIYAKYKNKAAVIAKKSQMVHIKAMRKMKNDMPRITF